MTNEGLAEARRPRPARIRVRLGDQPAPGAIPLHLPPRSMRAAGVVFGLFFLIFSAIEWSVVSDLWSTNVNGVFDLSVLLFQAFWALGWSVGVVVLGGLAVLFFFYSESARLEDGRLVYVPRLGPLSIPVDYELAKISNVRLEDGGGRGESGVRVKFDYEGVPTALGDTMSRTDGHRLVEALDAAMRLQPRVPPLPRPAGDAPAMSPRDRAAEVEAQGGPARLSVVALVAANLYPLAGVLLFDWDLASLMLLYWAESGIIAVYTILKIAVAGKWLALAAAPFFAGHFGGFMAAHFLFIYMLFVKRMPDFSAQGLSAELAGVFGPLAGSIAVLAASHGVSFFTNFIGRREYEGASVGALMHAPYERVVLMHVTLIAGGWIAMAAGAPDAALAILLALKTAVDARAHLNERQAAGRRRIQASDGTPG